MKCDVSSEFIGKYVNVVCKNIDDISGILICIEHNGIVIHRNAEDVNGNNKDISIFIMKDEIACIAYDTEEEY